MNILLTNDDGYKSPGIWALANRLKEKHNIYIVAPDGERSGASHSASFFAALSYVYHGNVDGVEVYSLSGTPADCVVFSVRYLLKDVKFDCVLSGINDVLNVGSDIMFSGTFGAAQEATYQGIKGVAISLRSNHTGDFAYAQHLVLGYIAYVAASEEGEHVVLTEAVYFDITAYDHIVGFGGEYRVVDDFIRLLAVAFGQEFHGLGITLRCPDKPFSVRVFADFYKQFSD